MAYSSTTNGCGFIAHLCWLGCCSWRNTTVTSRLPPQAFWTPSRGQHTRQKFPQTGVHLHRESSSRDPRCCRTRSCICWQCSIALESCCGVYRDIDKQSSGKCPVPHPCRGCWYPRANKRQSVARHECGLCVHDDSRYSASFAAVRANCEVALILQALARPFARQHTEKSL
jgi:hypothetical protein